MTLQSWKQETFCHSGQIWLMRMEPQEPDIQSVAENKTDRTATQDNDNIIIIIRTIYYLLKGLPLSFLPNECANFIFNIFIAAV